VLPIKTRCPGTEYTVMTTRGWTTLDFAVIPHVIAERSRGEERLVKTRVTLGFGKGSRAHGVRITNFGAAARVIPDAAACAGILNAQLAGPMPNHPAPRGAINGTSKARLKRAQQNMRGCGNARFMTSLHLFRVRQI
jgi:hypothetical protein